MEELGYDQKSKSAIERLVLIIVSWYYVGMISGTIALGYSLGYAMFFVSCAVIMWAAYLGKYKDYTFRCTLDSCIMLSSVLVHIFRLDNPSTSWITYITFVVLLGLFGNINVIKLSFISTTILVGYNFFLTDFFKSGYGDYTVLQIVIMAITTYVVTYVVYYVVRKQLDAQEVLLDNLDEVSEIERSKDDFLVNVSHELRTPVNVIAGMAELLKDEEGLSDQARERLNDIIIAGRSLNASLSDILDFTELQSGKMNIEEDVYSAEAVVEEVIKLSAERFREKNLEFIVGLSPDIPRRLVGDRGKITRVIMNILGNAIKFTTDGFVGLQISARQTEYGVNLNVMIRDTGKGMKKEDIEKIFTSFNQVDTRRNRSEGGIGLGLAISKELVDKMGGNIMVDSVYGSGTKVWFSVPQKVDDDSKLTYVRNVKSKRVAFCADLETFAAVSVRDAYMDNINGILGSLELDYRYFRNISELKRMMARAQFTHIIITRSEYEKDPGFFEDIAKRNISRLVLILENGAQKPHLDFGCSFLYKPYYSASIAEVISLEGDDNSFDRKDNFIAPDANILVVDDNRMNIAVMKGLLKRYQINAVGAMSGYEALDKIESMGYDLVFMDHMMPEMDGVETFEAIRSKPGSYYHEVPIIALTANVVAGTKEFFLEKGFTEYVPKPVEPQILDMVLRRNLPKNKQIIHAEEEKTSAPTSEELLKQELKEEIKEELREEVKEAVKEEIVKEGTDNPVTEEAQGESSSHALGDIQDEAEALKYCGSRDGMIEMMKINYEDGPESLSKMEDAFAAEDWKNYTIYVHALKSSMRTIGIGGLSKDAAALEAAGKEGRSDFILENHAQCMDKYRETLRMLYDSGLFETEELEIPEHRDVKAKTSDVEESSDKADKSVTADEPISRRDDTVTGEDKAEEAAEDEEGSDVEKESPDDVDSSQQLEELDPDEFEVILAEFEDGAYMMDADKLKSLLEELRGKSYKGKPLDEHLKKLKHKVEMGDYLSAFDSLNALK